MARQLCFSFQWLLPFSDTYAVVARLAHLSDPLINLVIALLPYLEILNPQSRGAKHWHLQHSFLMFESYCRNPDLLKPMQSNEADATAGLPSD